MIEKYVIVDRDNQEMDYEYDSYSDAVSEAEQRNFAVIARRYEFSDSELLWTPGNETSWPPK